MEILIRAVEESKWDVVKSIMKTMSPWDVFSMPKNENLYKKLKSKGFFEELRFMRNDPNEPKTGSPWKTWLATVAAEYVLQPSNVLHIVYRKLPKFYRDVNFGLTRFYSDVKFGLTLVKTDGNSSLFELYLEDLADLKRYRIYHQTGRANRYRQGYQDVEAANQTLSALTRITRIFDKNSEPWAKRNLQFDTYGNPSRPIVKISLLNSRLPSLLLKLLQKHDDAKIFIQGPKTGDAYLREQISCLTCNSVGVLQQEVISKRVFCDKECQIKFHCNPN